MFTVYRPLPAHGACIAPFVQRVHNAFTRTADSGTGHDVYIKQAQSLYCDQRPDLEKTFCVVIDFIRIGCIPNGLPAAKSPLKIMFTFCFGRYK